MRRLHLFEIHNQDWCPRMIRDAETDYLQFVIAKTKPYAAMVPVLVTALQRTGTRQVIDLCSGAGEPWQWLHPALAAKGLNVSVRLTDKYPNAGAVGQISRLANHSIRYHDQPFDATRVPEELIEFRTMFSAFHHFRPEEARAVWADAVRKRQGIGVLRKHTTVSGSCASLPIAGWWETSLSETGYPSENDRVRAVVRRVIEDIFSRLQPQAWHPCEAKLIAAVGTPASPPR